MFCLGGVLVHCLFIYTLPRNPKKLSCGNGEKKCLNEVEQVIDEKKYKCITLKLVIIDSRSRGGNVN